MTAETIKEFIYRQSLTLPCFYQFSVSSSFYKTMDKLRLLHLLLSCDCTKDQANQATVLSPAIDFDDHHSKTYQCTVSDSSHESADQAAGLACYH